MALNLDRLKTPEAKAGALFLALNLSAAVFNYLFQVIASRKLSPEEFARMNGWFANFALFYVVGGVLQFQANFRPLRKKALNLAIVGSSIVVLALWLLWPMWQEPLVWPHAAMVILSACMMGWLSGQAQIRLRLRLIAVTSLVTAILRVILTYHDFGVDPLSKYVLLNFLFYVWSVLIVCAGIWNAEDVEVPEKSGYLKSIILLSVAVNIIPQFDMFLMNHTQAEQDFVDFTRASLFGRGVFTIISIMAQWFLPRQIRAGKKAGHGATWKLIAAAVVVSAVVGFSSSFIATVIFNWERVPPQALVFLASLELSLLALIFIRVHAMCAKHDLKPAFFIVAVLVAEGVAQLFFQFPMWQFLAGAIVIQGLCATFIKERV